MKRILTVLIVLTIVSCIKDNDDGVTTYPDTKTYVDLNDRLPKWFSLRIEEPVDNPTTEEGIAFGRALFYEPLLSADGSQACADCHLQEYGFAENRKFSQGIDGIEGDRNAMNLINLGLTRTQNRFFWNGRAKSLEDQAFEPITNPIEMHNTWKNVEEVLNSSLIYREMCQQAFGSRTIDSNKVVKAIAQFERSIISGNSKFDRYKNDPINNRLSEDELKGLALFRRDRLGPGQPGADCFHCHGEETDFTDGLFHNNGLDLIPDSGRMVVTGDTTHFGTFKTPTLRNLKFTGPYMHDGRFETLDEVIDFYSDNVNPHSINIDPLMNKNIGGVKLNDDEKAQLKAFLLTLTDNDFVNNPAYSDPNKY